jgi:hypothetical protein
MRNYIRDAANQSVYCICRVILKALLQWLHWDYIIIIITLTSIKLYDFYFVQPFSLLSNSMHRSN